MMPTGTNDHRWAVIMAGGSGTRFWPASRTARPKQLLPLVARADEATPSRSLLAATVARIAPIVPIERTLVVTAAHLIESSRRELPNLPAENLLAEPAPRNTAPCIGWATRVIGARDPDAVVAVLPSDQHIGDEREMVATIDRAMRAAVEYPLVTIGLRPTRPDTGFGYIEVGDVGGGHDADKGARLVARFVEKPDELRARAYVDGGKHLWNSGMFFFRAREMDAAIRRHMPDLARGLDTIEGDASSLPRVFPGLPSISIDYGIVEAISAEPHGGRIAVVVGDFGWSDVGSWQSAWELAAKDAEGNALNDGSIAIDARGNLARSDNGKIIALVGVEGLVVVETDDAILVMPRGRAQDVRLVVEALKASGRSRHT